MIINYILIFRRDDGTTGQKRDSNLKPNDCFDSHATCDRDVMKLLIG